MADQTPSSEESPRFARAIPCPECASTRGYNRVGKYRVQCQNCNSLLKNSEVNLEDQEPQ
jgi:uncharacterized protein (DUF983 family)